MPGIDPYGGFTITDRLHVDALSFDGELLTISGSVRGSEAHCPVCDQTSRRVHSHYTRTLADLPWSGTPVRLRLQVRKFFCDEPACERRIFAERLGGVARVRARTTDRRREALEWIAFALGGEAGARLARELGLLVSPDTLLNRIRETFFSEGEDVRVVGVEDFGFRRGHASGTILVDLERRRVVDLFEGHSVESIARWLGQHPSVKMVGRDRSNVCREGAWKAYCRRFDLEHTIRFLKQTLSWTTPRFRHPEQADRWTWLVLAAYTQLRLARAIVADGASLALSTHHPRP